MAKTEVYSWRLSPETKSALEDAARREQATVASLLERIVQEWLGNWRRDGGADDEAQARLHRAVARTVGTITGKDPRRAERTGELVRQRLRSHRAR
jgi:hypothetical protein